jgi:hypothetical protein
MLLVNTDVSEQHVASILKVEVHNVEIKNNTKWRCWLDLVQKTVNQGACDYNNETSGSR